MNNNNNNNSNKNNIESKNKTNSNPRELNSFRNSDNKPYRSRGRSRGRKRGRGRGRGGGGKDGENKRTFFNKRENSNSNRNNSSSLNETPKNHSHESKPSSINSKPFTPVGTCLTMCPLKEKMERQKMNEISEKFEFDENSFPCVKRFQRSAAGIQVDWDLIRPIHVLRRTVSHLYKNIIFSTSSKYIDIYIFVSDRLRSVIQDITVQRDGFNSTLIYGEHDFEALISTGEDIVKFYIDAQHRLNDIKPEFLPLNMQQLNNAFASLMKSYDQTPSFKSTLSQASYYMSLYTIFLAATPSINSHLSRVISFLRSKSYLHIFHETKSSSSISKTSHSISIYWDSSIQRAVDITRYLHFGRYRSFFQLVEDPEIPYLASCIIHTHFTRVRINAMQSIYQAFAGNASTTQKEVHLPVEYLISILGFDDFHDLESFLSHSQFGSISHLDNNSVILYGSFNSKSQDDSSSSSSSSSSSTYSSQSSSLPLYQRLASCSHRLIWNKFPEMKSSLCKLNEIK